jgi:hypothetical protein
MPIATCGRLGQERAEPAPERAGERLGSGQERGACGRPDLAVGRRAFRRTERQDERAQEDLPGQPRQVDDAPVRQEFRQEPTHRFRRRSVRRAEVDDEDAAPGWHGGTIPEGARPGHEAPGQEKAGRKPPGHDRQ